MKKLFSKTRWQNIHKDFTLELKKEWKNKGFTFEQCKDWISIYSEAESKEALENPDFFAWLRDTKKVDAVWVLSEGNPEELGKEYRDFKDHNQPNTTVPQTDWEEKIKKLQEQKNQLEQWNLKSNKEANELRKRNNELLEDREKADMRARNNEKYKEFYEEEREKLEDLKKSAENYYRISESERKNKKPCEVVQHADLEERLLEAQSNNKTLQKQLLELYERETSTATSSEGITQQVCSWYV